MDTKTTLFFAVINIIAAIIGPISAVIITLWYQGQKEKRDAKQRVFFTLMGQRKSIPPTYALAEALNMIDVVFADKPEITKLWHEYYDLLRRPPEAVDFEAQGHKYIELLSEIAKSLGYKSIQQTDIDKFYQPQAHASQFELSSKLQTELLRVLENTSSFVVSKKDDSTKS